VGTSLGGLTADQVALHPAYRSAEGKSIGMVIVNLQQTAQDGHASLRLFGKADDVFHLVLTKLAGCARARNPPTLSDPVGSLGPLDSPGHQRGRHMCCNIPSQIQTQTPTIKPIDIVSLNRIRSLNFHEGQALMLERFVAVPSRVLLPYNAKGYMLKAPHTSTEPWMYLDLRKGARVRITSGHNIRGARQPAFLHIDAKKPYNGRAPSKPEGRVVSRDDLVCGFLLQIAGANMRLGTWWIESAQRGALDKLPIVNVCPEYGSPGVPHVDW